MNQDPNQDALRRVQADLADVSVRLARLSEDFRRLAEVLPVQLPGGAPSAQQPAAPGRPQQPIGGQPAQQPGWAPPDGRRQQPWAPPGAPPPQPTPAGPGQPQWLPPTGPAHRVAGPPRHGQPATAGAGQPQPVGVPLAPQDGAGRPSSVPVQRSPFAPRTPRRQVSVAEIFSIFGSAITLIGVAFVLMLPQDGVLGTIPRTVIGMVLAAAAVGAALWQHSKDPKNIGAQALMATGVASAFLCIVAVTVLFVGPDGRRMLPEIAGLALAGLVSVGGVWIARAWHSQWLAVLAILGSLLLAPYLVQGEVIWALAFMVVMSIGTAAFQRGLAWVGLMAARLIPTSLVFIGALLEPSASVSANPLVVLSLAALLAAAGLGMAVLHQETTRPEQLASVAFMVLTAGPLMIAAWDGNRFVAALACAVLGAAYAACGLLEKQVSELVRSAAVPLGATFVAFAIIRSTDGEYLGYIYFALAAAYFALAASTRFKPVLAVAGVLAVIGVAHWLPLAVTPIGLAMARGHGVEHVLESLLGLTVTLLAARALRVFLGRRPSLLSYATWAASVVFGSVALVLAGTVVGERLGDPATWFQAAHAVVTVAWLLLCVVLLRLGLRRTDSGLVPVRLAIALAIAAVAKLFLFDLATLPDLVRALAFLAVGVLLLVIGTWYNRQLDRVRKALPPPGPPPADAAPVGPAVQTGPAAQGGQASPADQRQPPSVPAPAGGPAPPAAEPSPAPPPDQALGN